MTSRTDYRYIAPLDPEAEKACRLTTSMASRRAESAEEFFGDADDQAVLPNGYELRFTEAGNTARRIDAFIEAEQECCPFFAFETWREGSVHVIRILRLDPDAETPEKLPESVAPGARARAGDVPEGEAP